MDPSGSVVEQLAARARDAARAREEEHQRLVLDVVLERRRRPAVVRRPQQQRAVAAVEEVGVSAVASEDLDERRATVGSSATVELGSAAFGPLERKLAHRRSRLRRAPRRPWRVTAGGSVRRRPRATRRRRRHRAPRRAARPGTPALPATAITTASTTTARSVARRHGRPSQGLPTRGRRGGAGQIGEGGKACRGDPRAGPQRVREAAGHVDRGVEHEPQRPDRRGGEEEESERVGSAAATSSPTSTASGITTTKIWVTASSSWRSSPRERAPRLVRDRPRRRRWSSAVRSR